jgi:peptidoglycan/LPS O-acetylase OafA/YrhL
MTWASALGAGMAEGCRDFRPNVLFSLLLDSLSSNRRQCKLAAMASSNTLPVTADERPVALKAVGSADSHAVRYRSDIDGMRAIAVLSVIFYHVYGSGIPGGFLGVDMFFVLSGFLITSIIWREAQLREFAIRRFYERRVRRILPALVVVLAATTIAATIVLLPADLLGYAKSLIATVGFAANLYFWHDADYFARSAEYKPLLHMWSLGVEEQFYIFFPLMLVFLARFHARVALLVTAGLALASFAANTFFDYTDYTNNGGTAFWLLPTRAWELGTGAIIALLPTKVAPRGTAEALGFLGLLLIAIGMFMPLPSSWAVPAGTPVVLGTAMLVFAGRAIRLPAVNRALSISPVVFVGLISYSLYLWHWPVLVLLRYYFVNGVSLPVYACALVFIFAAATASWHFVERPFRSKQMPIRKVLLAATSSVAALAAIAILIVGRQGLPQRFSAQAATINAAVGSIYRCSMSSKIWLGLLRVCRLNLPGDADSAQAVLLGNSHADMYAPAWDSIFVEHHVKALLFPTTSGCLPTVQSNYTTDCIVEARRYLAAVVALPHVRTVIVGLTWWPTDLVDPRGRVLPNGDNRALIAAIDDLDRRIERSGKRVILIGPILRAAWDVPTTLGRELAYGFPIDRNLYLPQHEFMAVFAPAIRHFESEKDIVFVHAYEAQCQKGRCYYVLDGQSLYADNNHIAEQEVWRFRPLFEAAFNARGD